MQIYLYGSNQIKNYVFDITAELARCIEDINQINWEFNFSMKILEDMMFKDGYQKLDKGAIKENMRIVNIRACAEFASCTIQKSKCFEEPKTFVAQKVMFE